MFFSLFVFEKVFFHAHMKRYYLFSIFRLTSSSLIFFLLVTNGSTISMALLFVLLYGISFFFVQVKFSIGNVNPILTLSVVSFSYLFNNVFIPFILKSIDANLFLLHLLISFFFSFLVYKILFLFKRPL